MQSRGVGNCINTLALRGPGALPLLMLVTMRGEWPELNPWQNPAGCCEPGLERSACAPGGPTAPRTSSRSCKPLAMAFAGDMSGAVLLGQRLIGREEVVSAAACSSARGRRRAARRARAGSSS